MKTIQKLIAAPVLVAAAFAFVSCETEREEVITTPETTEVETEPVMEVEPAPAPEPEPTLTPAPEPEPAPALEPEPAPALEPAPGSATEAESDVEIEVPESEFGE